MGLSVKPLLHPRKRDDGTHRVTIRLTKDRKTVFMEAGFTLAPKHWNEKATLSEPKWVRGTMLDSGALNEQLQKFVLVAMATERQHPGWTGEQIREHLLALEGRTTPEKTTPVNKGGPPAELVAFASYYVRERERKDKPSTVIFYRRAAKNLADWRADQPLPFAQITQQHLTDFAEWLRVHEQLFTSTVRDRLLKVGTILLRAQKLGVLKQERNPFVDFVLPRSGRKSPPPRPSDAQRTAVLALDIAAHLEGHCRRHVYAAALAVKRDVWALQYLVRGSRCGDMLLLRERDVRADRISFIEHKTSKAKSVARTPAINEILARYPATGHGLAFVFPILDHTRPYAAEHPTIAEQEMLLQVMSSKVGQVNDALKKLAGFAGVPPFTSHSARHMYTEKAYSKTKDLRLVQAMLNHSNIATTERYLSTLGYDALDAATELILE